MPLFENKITLIAIYKVHLHSTPYTERKLAYMSCLRYLFVLFHA